MNTKNYFSKARPYTRLHFMGIGVNHLVIKFGQKFDNISILSLGKKSMNNRFWSNYKAIS